PRAERDLHAFPTRRSSDLKLDALEEKLHNPKAQVAYDILAMKGGAKLYSQLIFLYNLLLESDGAPTQGIREVHAEQSAELHRLRSEEHTSELQSPDHLVCR